MALSEPERRAIEHAERAQRLIEHGEGDAATQALREALSLAPTDEKIQGIAKSIQENEALQPLLKWCRKFAQEGDLPAGKDAVWFLASDAAKSVPSDVAEKALVLLIEAKHADATVRDDLVAGMLQQCLGSRRYVARQLQTSASMSFEDLFEIGDGAANGITVVSLDQGAWVDESVRRTCEQDVFILFLAKLLQSGHDHDGRALKGISRHLAIDAERLHTHVDEQGFAAILVCLDYRLSEEVRGHAMLAIAKFLEASQDIGQAYLTRFITTRTAKHANEDLVLAFSVAAAVFPIATPLCASLFLVEGFLPSLIPLLDKKSRPIKVEKAALDMLSAACIDAGCRVAIGKYCRDWMHHVMDDEEDERHGQAALILAKVQSQPENTPSDGSVPIRRPSKDIADVVPRLKDMILNGSEIDQRTGIEGLAYASVQAPVKEDVVNDTTLLKKLFRLPKKDSILPTTAFGFLTLIDNLTRYLPVLTEEQRKMTELRAYANSSKPQEKPNPLDEDNEVTHRCKTCLDAHIVPFLITLKTTSVASPLSPTCLGLMAKVLLSLARTSANRGSLVQQGAISLLLQIYGTKSMDDIGRAVTAHAVAKILISIDPSLISGSAGACVRPLLSLLDQTSSFASGDQPKDLLPMFEALLGLTNLASTPSLSTGPAIAVSGYSTIEDLLLSSNNLVQRAATELVCNLTNNTSDGLAKLADGSAEASRRINILVALSDAELVATRRAASGALAGALDYPSTIKAVLKREGGVNRLLDLCSDADQGCIFRGVVCIRSMVCCEDDAGNLAQKAIIQEGGKDVLGQVIKGSKDRQIIENAVEALKILMSLT